MRSDIAQPAGAMKRERAAAFQADYLAIEILSFGLCRRGYQIGKARHDTETAGHTREAKPVLNQADFDTARYARVPTLEICGRNAREGGLLPSTLLLGPIPLRDQRQFSAPSKCTAFDNRALGGLIGNALRTR